MFPRLRMPLWQLFETGHILQRLTRKGDRSISDVDVDRCDLHEVAAYLALARDAGQGGFDSQVLNLLRQLRYYLPR